MEQKQEQTEEEIIVEVADTLDGQHFNIVVYPSRVIVTRVAGKTHGTRRYTNDLQTASLQQQVKELKEENERLKEKMLAFFKAAEYQNMDDFLLRGKLGDFIKLGSLTSVRIKELKEENERIRGVIGDMVASYEQYGELYTTVIAAAKQALTSGKESKTE
jgi:hypothetical protein